MQYLSENSPGQAPKLHSIKSGEKSAWNITASVPSRLKRFILHFGKKHPRDMGEAEVEQFLTHLVINGKVAASTQNQAKCALSFLYKEVLAIRVAVAG